LQAGEDWQNAQRALRTVLELQPGSTAAQGNLELLLKDERRHAMQAKRQYSPTKEDWQGKRSGRPCLDASDEQGASLRKVSAFCPGFRIVGWTEAPSCRQD